MPERPDGVLLLTLARAALLDKISAELSGGSRYTARLVANAMAIAARELEAGEGPSRVECDALARLFGEDREEATSPAGNETTDEALERLRWRLAAEIRAGDRDADGRVHALLKETALARLRIVNPRAIEEV